MAACTGCTQAGTEAQPAGFVMQRRTVQPKVSARAGVGARPPRIGKIATARRRRRVSMEIARTLGLHEAG